MNTADCIESLLVDPLPCDLNKHFHEEFTVTCILAGECSLWVDNRLIPLQKGDLVFMPEYVVHSCIPSQDSTPSYRIYTITGSESSPDIDRLKIYTGDYRIIHEQSPVEDELFIRTLLSRIREFSLHKKRSGSAPQAVDGVLKLVTDHISSECRSDIRLDDLAEVSGLSKYYLVNRFKCRFGITPHAYFLNVRINRARELLKTEMSIVDISLSLGFYDQSHFTNTFLRYTGTTPSEYRKKICRPQFFTIHVPE